VNRVRRGAAGAVQRELTAGERERLAHVAAAKSHSVGRLHPVASDAQNMNAVLQVESSLPFEAFRLRWRFEPPQRNPPPAHQLARIHVLSEEGSRRLWELTQPLHTSDPFTAGLFRDIASTSLAESSPSDVRKWLYRRGLPCAHDVYLSWSSDTSVRTSWKLLVKYWDDFWYPMSDDLTVIDGDMGWALLLHHEGEAFFGRDTAEPRHTPWPYRAHSSR
jgi:hypothetical protein